MTSELAFYVGLLLLFTGVACGGVAAVLGGRYRLIMVGGIPFLIAGALLVQMARERHRFRVTALSITRIGDYEGRCPGEQRVRIRVRTAGGEGRVAFRIWVDEQFDSPLHVVRARPGRPLEFATSVTIESTGLTTAYAAVDAPNHAVASALFQVRCRGD